MEEEPKSAENQPAPEVIALPIENPQPVEVTFPVVPQPAAVPVEITMPPSPKAIPLPAPVEAAQPEQPKPVEKSAQETSAKRTHQEMMETNVPLLESGRMAEIRKKLMESLPQYRERLEKISDEELEEIYSEVEQNRKEPAVEVERKELYHSKGKGQETWVSEINWSKGENTGQTYIMGHEHSEAVDGSRKKGSSWKKGKGSSEERRRLVEALTKIADCLEKQ